LPTSHEIRLHEIRNPKEIPPWTDHERIAGFFHETMRPWHDALPDVSRGLDHALTTTDDRSGFVLLAAQAEELAGGLAMLDTGMGGFVPKYLLLFVAVRPDLRGKGIGQTLVKQALSMCDGAVKLHVEYDNPAKRLYERLGFTTKYAEMRYQP